MWFPYLTKFPTRQRSRNFPTFQLPRLRPHLPVRRRHSPFHPLLVTAVLFPSFPLGGPWSTAAVACASFGLHATLGALNHVTCPLPFQSFGPAGIFPCIAALRCPQPSHSLSLSCRRSALRAPIPWFIDPGTCCLSPTRSADPTPAHPHAPLYYDCPYPRMPLRVPFPSFPAMCTHLWYLNFTSA